MPGSRGRSVLVFRPLATGEHRRGRGRAADVDAGADADAEWAELPRARRLQPWCSARSRSAGQGRTTGVSVGQGSATECSGAEGVAARAPSRTAGGLGSRDPHAATLERVGVLGEHDVGRPVGDDSATLLEEHQPVDQVEPGADAVLDDQERGPGVVEEGSDGVVHLHDTVRVEVRARLVEHQRTRPHREDTRERQPLSLTAGQPRGGAVERQVESDDVERMAHPEPDVAALDTQVLAPEGHVVADPGHHGVGLGILHDEADPPADGHGCDSVDEDRPLDCCCRVVRIVRIIGEHTCRGAEERRLPGTGRPDDGDALTGFDDQVDAADGPGAPLGIAPAPAGEGDPSGDGRHAAEARGRRPCSRPAAKDDSTPVRARARTSSQDPRPEMTTPEMIAQMTYVTWNATVAPA